MNTYRIRGYTGPNADFDFTLHSPVAPTGTDLRDVVSGHFTHDCDWATDLDSCDPYYLSDAEERSDLRESESQRVYLFSGNDCIVHSGDEECDGNECDSVDYMITVDIEGDNR